MPACRMELADVGSPEKLVQLILRDEPDLPVPVPIEDLCRQLDISAIEDLDSEKFEGGLITDEARSEGIILVKRGFEPRRRFTIAHELGHFLMPKHVPDQPGRFLCSSQDLFRLHPKEGDRRQRMEVEANRFASLILMPPPRLRAAMSAYQEPSLQHVPVLARQFNVSKEAMVRAYVQNHEALIAVVLTQDGKVLRTYRHISFPFVVCTKGQPVPAGSLYHRGLHERGIASDLMTCIADHWIEVRRGERAPTLYEQVYALQNGIAYVLLHVERPDEDEEENERAVFESWRVGFGTKRRRRR